jgi:hypothetical protein
MSRTVISTIIAPITVHTHAATLIKQAEYAEVDLVKEKDEYHRIIAKCS